MVWTTRILFSFDPKVPHSEKFSCFSLVAIGYLALPFRIVLTLVRLWAWKALLCYVPIEFFVRGWFSTTPASHSTGFRLNSQQAHRRTCFHGIYSVALKQLSQLTCIREDWEPILDLQADCNNSSWFRCVLYISDRTIPKRIQITSSSSAGRKINIKTQFSLAFPLRHKETRWRGGNDPGIINFGIRDRWEKSYMLRPLYSRHTERAVISPQNLP